MRNVLVMVLDVVRGDNGPLLRGEGVGAVWSITRNAAPIHSASIMSSGVMLM